MNIQQIIHYTPTLDILNMAALPAGTGAKYLECITNWDGGLIAKQWRRKLPKSSGIFVQFVED